VRGARGHGGGVMTLPPVELGGRGGVRTLYPPLSWAGEGVS
jgi:hypothetical protein